jgi:hypothetical protein
MKLIEAEEKLAGFYGKLICGTRKSPLTLLSKGELGDIVLISRNEAGRCTTNVPRRFIFSDEDTWGYGGTGPQCLAANILFHFLSDEKAAKEKVHLLVEDVIKDLPIDESCLLHGEFIESWIKSKT